MIPTVTDCANCLHLLALLAIFLFHLYFIIMQIGLSEELSSSIAGCSP